MTSKRYYWLKLSEDFFQEDTIKWIEEQENGVAYAYFYLKLCVKSLADNGSLVRYVGDKLLPYDIKALSRLTNIDTDTVRVAMKLFEEIGLIETLSTGEIYMNQINEMIGSETDSARRMRKKRARDKLIESEKMQVLKNPETRNRHIVQNCDSDVQKSDIEYRDKSIEYRDKSIDIEQEDKCPDKCTYKCTPEIEIDKDIEIEREVEQEEKKRTTTTSTFYEKIISSWNGLGLQNLRTISNQRKTLLNTRLKEFGEQSIFEAIDQVEKSSFLKGQNKTGWTITFDWLIRPNNFPKVLEGNYLDQDKEEAPRRRSSKPLPKSQNFKRREYDDEDKVEEYLKRQLLENFEKAKKNKRP